jgi:hypothetical protein
LLRANLSVPQGRSVGVSQALFSSCFRLQAEACCFGVSDGWCFRGKGTADQQWRFRKKSRPVEREQDR